MMYSYYPFWIHLYWIFILLVLFAFAAGVVWLVRFANKESVKTALWIALIFGLLGLLLSSPGAYNGMGEMMVKMMQEVDDGDDEVDENDDDYDDARSFFEEMMDWDESEE